MYQDPDFGVIETSYRTRELLRRINGDNDMEIDNKDPPVHFKLPFEFQEKCSSAQTSVGTAKNNDVAIFWEALARGEKTIELGTYFLIFILPNSTQIYEWFLGDAPCSSLYNFVSQFLEKDKTKKISISFPKGHVPNSEEKIKEVIRITGDDHKRMILSVNFV